MKKIESDDELQSLHVQARGYIYNDYRGATPNGADGNVLHPAKYSHVAKSSTNYCKFFFDDYADAKAWLERNRGREAIAWRRCHRCPEIDRHRVFFHIPLILKAKFPSSSLTSM